MNRYWLAQNGETTGPFAEEVLLSMWQHGKIQIDAQVCLEGMEDWIDAKFLINEMETVKEQASKAVQHQQLRQEQRHKEAKRTLREKSKSRLGAFVLSWLYPGLGHLYCGYWGQALVFFIFGTFLYAVDFNNGMILFSPFAVILSGLTSIGAAKQRNQQLEDELGF